MIVQFPLAVFVICFIVLCVSTQIGVYIRRRGPKQDEADREDLAVILAATLTLLGLIDGFTFSMALSRYDQRKQYESAEANAIGTEYLRVGLLPKADALKLRQLLKAYLDQRILFYQTRDARQLEQLSASTGRVQSELWAAVDTSAATQPTATAALAASGMNEVLDLQGFTQAAWWNRIPLEAWGLMAVIAIGSNLLLGYTSRRGESRNPRFFFLPLLLAIAFLLIADLDSPREGIVRVRPQNLVSLSASMEDDDQAQELSLMAVFNERGLVQLFERDTDNRRRT
jgi:hypothetical protein